MSELEDKIKSLAAKGNLREDLLINHPAWNIIFDKELKTRKTTEHAMYRSS